MDNRQGKGVDSDSLIRDSYEYYREASHAGQTSDMTLLRRYAQSCYYMALFYESCDSTQLLIDPQHRLSEEVEFHLRLCRGLLGNLCRSLCWGLLCNLLRKVSVELFIEIQLHRFRVRQVDSAELRLQGIQGQAYSGKLRHNVIQNLFLRLFHKARIDYLCVGQSTKLQQCF